MNKRPEEAFMPRSQDAPDYLIPSKDLLFWSGGQPRVKPDPTPHVPTALMKKLGEKLAYERAFLRLYEAYFRKRWGAARALGNPLAEGLSEYDELVAMKRRHLELLSSLMRAREGDPSLIVPSEELSAIARLGIVSVFTSPESSLKTMIQAIRIVELAGRTICLYLQRLADSHGDIELRDTLSTMQSECDEKLQSVTRLVMWDGSRKKATGHLRPVRKHFTTLH